VSFNIFLDHSWLCRLTVWELQRVVSHHNKLKSIQRASLSNETVNDRRIISVNGAGTDVGRHDVYMLCYKTSTVFR